MHFVVTSKLPEARKAKSVDLKPDHYLTMRKIADILAPFEEATTIFSGESYVTFSVVHPVVEHLVKVLSAMSQQVLAVCESEKSDDEGDDSDESEARSDTENDPEQASKPISSGDTESLSTMATVNMIDELTGSVTSRFQSVLVDDAYRMASFLDPRFKATYCQLADVTADIKNEMRRMSTDRSETASHWDVSSPASVTVIDTGNITAAAASGAASSSVDSDQCGVGVRKTSTEKTKRTSFWDVVEREQASAKRARLANEGVNDDLETR